MNQIRPTPSVACTDGPSTEDSKTWRYTAELEGATAEIMEVRSDHASKIRIVITNQTPEP